jgi:hypothetical protein
MSGNKRVKCICHPEFVGMAINCPKCNGGAGIPAPVSDPFIAGEEARLRKRHEDSGTNRPYYSGD